MTPPRKPQVRVRWTKQGKVRFTSHRDMARIWERAVRRAQLPIAYSEGFSPRAKLSFGLALPTVFESRCEFVDMMFDETVETVGLADRLTPTLPVGVDVTGVARLEGKVDSLQACVVASQWSLFVQGDVAEAKGWAASLLAADELVVERERKGRVRSADVRSGLHSIEVLEAGEVDEVLGANVEIRAELASQPVAIRPLEFLAINSPSLDFVLGRRTHQFIAPAGARQDPLSVGAAAEAPRDLSCVT